VDDELRTSQDEFLALEAEKVIAARYSAMRALGCDAEAAVVVAVYPEIAIEAAVELLECGYESGTVVGILLGGERPATAL